MIMKRTLILLIVLLVRFTAEAQEEKAVIRVGAKHFNEGYILSEMIALILEDGGYAVERRFNLGGTAVTFEALRNNAIDIYPEYTGTLTAEVLKTIGSLTHQQINDSLKARFGLELSQPYGFNNTYALLMKQDRARALNISRLSDLQKHPELMVGLSYEFLKRRDGWNNLAAFYELAQNATGLEHGLAYQAVLEGKIEVTDAYSTDGEISRYNLLLLEDDRRFFPEYQAVSFYRTSLPQKAKSLLQKLDAVISAREMQQLNAQALFEKKDHRQIACDFLVQKRLIQKSAGGVKASVMQDMLIRTLVHLRLTLIALLAAILVALPVGMLVYRHQTLSRFVLYVTGILQTIPSIALLALMIPLAGIGWVPATIALFIYALLPILRNTVTGLFAVDPKLKEVASAIGLNSWHCLRLVELPLAMPSILTGIRTAAVISVGTATLAAFIGAGGLGEFVVTGLALNNTSLILQGAIPAAILSVIIELLFEFVEWFFIPKHLRQKSLSSP